MENDMTSQTVSSLDIHLILADLLSALHAIAAVTPAEGKAAKNRGAMLHMQAIAKAAIARAETV